MNYSVNNDMDESHTHSVELKRNDYTLYYSIFMKFENKLNKTLMSTDVVNE